MRLAKCETFCYWQHKADQFLRNLIRRCNQISSTRPGALSGMSHSENFCCQFELSLIFFSISQSQVVSQKLTVYFSSAFSSQKFVVSRLLRLKWKEKWQKTLPQKRIMTMHRTSLKVSVLSIATLKIQLNQISVVNYIVQPPPPASPPSPTWLVKQCLDLRGTHDHLQTAIWHGARIALTNRKSYTQVIGQRLTMEPQHQQQYNFCIID